MRPITEADLDRWFAYHPPADHQVPRYEAIRDAARQFALLILRITPSCPDQSVAIRKVREAVSAANMAIACEETRDA